MKVLLLGDFSSLHKYLKDGLTELGVDVTLISTGDSYKKIENDYKIGSDRKGFLGNLEKLASPIIHLPRMMNYDVVQLINPKIFPSQFGYNTFLLSIILNSADHSFLYACGDDAFYWQYQNAFRYSPHRDHIKYDLENGKVWWLSKEANKLNNWVIDHVDGIMPTGYFYHFANKDKHKNVQFTPLPINCDEIKYEPNIVEDKVVFFHGILREGFKGTRYVREAFKIVKNKYPDDAEVIIDGNMPFDTYVKVLNKTNVVIDQVLTYSPGMNALISMAMGKVVLSGSEPEFLSLLGAENTPLVNITPDVNDIIQKMEHIIHNKNKILEWGKNSREYVEQYHSHIGIAKKMLQHWTSNT